MNKKKQFTQLKEGDNFYRVCSLGSIKVFEVSEPKLRLSQSPFASDGDKDLELIAKYPDGEFIHLLFADIGEEHIVKHGDFFYYSDLTSIGDFVEDIVSDFTKLVTGQKKWYQEGEDQS